MNSTELTPTLTSNHYADSNLFNPLSSQFSMNHSIDVDQMYWKSQLQITTTRLSWSILQSAPVKW